MSAPLSDTAARIVAGCPETAAAGETPTREILEGVVLEAEGIICRELMRLGVDAPHGGEVMRRAMNAIGAQWTR